MSASAPTPTSATSSAASTPGVEHHTGLHLPHMHLPHPHMPHPHLGETLSHAGKEILEAAAYMGPGIALLDVPAEVEAREAPSHAHAPSEHPAAAHHESKEHSTLPSVPENPTRA
ncbi:hypothetical protein EXIGLDRAFT_830501 [Exidia glandulosa HHB12029]|uniref:Uncharacterized protein n=1 Tax=Exidia glandulosa HHB12029 TaxID=1314781 RepID=A0A166BGG2_EXIGL|nr:hypothetical protein EXIGLDRAFT_830501 [Exidia glandulosa HHB12029]